MLLSLHKLKGDAPESITCFIAGIKKQVVKTIWRFRSDHGREFVHIKLSDYIAKQSIKHELGIAHSDKGKRVGEPFNQPTEKLMKPSSI